MWQVMVERHFSASHILDNYEGDCARLHGHNYRVQVFVRGQKLDPKTKLLIDFKDLKSHLQTIIDKLDHRHLNDILDTQTCAELVATFFYDRLSPHIPAHLTLSEVRIWETPTCYASYFGPNA